MINDNVPCCDTCIHACLYVPYWSYPSGEVKCEITRNFVQHDDACCEHYDDGVCIPRKCIMCGVNISDLSKGEIYCEYCKIRGV